MGLPPWRDTAGRAGEVLLLLIGASQQKSGCENWSLGQPFLICAPGLVLAAVCPGTMQEISLLVLLLVY